MPEEKKLDQIPTVELQKSSSRIAHWNAAISRFAHECFTIGTPIGGITFAIIGVLVAAMLIVFGVWHTILLVCFGAVGAFIGAVPNKGEWIKGAINKLFPPKN